MNKYDLHIHSYFSPCGYMKPKAILRIAKEKGLNGIAITDHDTMRAYPILKKLNKDKDLEIIPGEEVHTEYGDVLGLYLHKEIKSRKLLEVIDEIKNQGGIIIIPHPYRRMFYSRDYAFKYPLSKLKGKIDAVETFNSRNFSGNNKLARKDAVKYGFAQVGSSDSHVHFDISNGYTLFDGDLRQALKNKRTEVGGTTKYNILSSILAGFKSKIVYPFTGPKK